MTRIASFSTLVLGFSLLYGCSGTFDASAQAPGVRIGMGYTDNPKNPQIPKPLKGQEPDREITLFGQTWDVYGSADCPSWAQGQTNGKWLYLTCPEGDPRVQYGPGSGRFVGTEIQTADVGAIDAYNLNPQQSAGGMRPVNGGGFNLPDAIADQLARGFGDDALPPPADATVFELLTMYGLLDHEPTDPDFSVAAHAAWRFNNVDDHFADIVLHMRSDLTILPPTLYDVQYELYSRDNPDDALPGYFRVRIKGELNAVLAYLADMGFTEITVDDELRGTTETIAVDQDTRLISWDGVPTSLYADPTPDGIE